jgi:membrane protein YdbS with pleckstrin-like domain
VLRRSVVPICANRIGSLWPLCCNLSAPYSMTHLSKRDLAPGERLLHSARLHGAVYWPPCVILGLGVALSSFDTDPDNHVITYWASLILLLIAILSAIRASLRLYTTELAVTDRRIIHTTGMLARSTAEMNLDRIEIVSVTQGVFGRFMNYGSVDVRGTSAGIHNLKSVKEPLKLRNAITSNMKKR